MVPALEEVARSGFTEEAKMSAQRTLAALNPAAVTAAPHATDAPHLMMSCSFRLTITLHDEVSD